MPKIQDNGKGQLSVNFPKGLSRALGWKKGDVVGWDIINRNRLILKRRQTSETIQKKEESVATIPR